MLGQRSKDAISQMILRSILPTAFQWLTVLEVSMWLAIRLAAIFLARQVGRLVRRVLALATIGNRYSWGRLGNDVFNFRLCSYDGITTAK